eukprot:TRINITY_DN18603_c0_g1_i1.p1 TRINITY_DN18603_c0_g1~~TRINITY_DN18603_c0_g1_i1.p1  ORF type:complete len:145 (-),score=23.19 TRINITY_DN18603_c0_g1_i1:92-526(-)
MEIWSRGVLPALVAIALCLLNVTGESQGDEPDLSVPADPGSSDLDSKVLALDDLPKMEFHRVRNLAMLHQGVQVTADSRQECEAACIENTMCKSVSYRARDNKCYQTPETLRYSPSWKLHIKQTKMNAIGLMVATGEYLSLIHI